MRSKIDVASRLHLESLETRTMLDGHGAACGFEMGESPTAKASQAINCFAADVYEHLANEDGNIFFSPLSLSTALAMTAAGARGNTATQMQEVMYLGDSPDVHESFGALLNGLSDSDRAIDLNLANGMWPQIGWEVKEPFVELVGNNYRSYLQSVDFINDPEGARQRINQQVADETQNRIEELIPDVTPPAIDPLTRLVLTNAIHYKADWAIPFQEFSTQDAPFELADGSSVQVPTMVSQEYNRHTVIDGFDVVVMEQGKWDEFSFESGGTSVVLIVPGDDATADDLSPETLAEIDRWLQADTERLPIDIHLPKFETKVSLDLKKLLGGMGMSDMLNPDLSDFAGITDNPSFYITDVFHEAFIDVNEQGTEATAATAVIGGIICFAAGTPVVTPSGEQAIESLQAGDFVLSRDEHNLVGKIEPKVIEETFENEVEIWELRIGGELVRTTSEHPFFVQEKGWTPVSKLQVGDLLSGDLTSWHELEHVQATGQVEKVYNFRVADHHTYFVGSEDWGFTVWTHNRCGDEAVAVVRADEPFHLMIRDDVSSSMLFLGRISDPTEESNELKPEVEEDAKPLDGDANGDGVVDFVDFLVFSENFGKAADVAFADGDFDEDGKIDFTDFLILQGNFGRSVA